VVNCDCLFTWTVTYLLRKVNIGTKNAVVKKKPSSMSFQDSFKSSRWMISSQEIPERDTLYYLLNSSSIISPVSGL